MARAITEILKEADSANEHIRKLALSSDGDYFTKGRFYMHLNGQVDSVVS
jgi:hypothetical protein